MRNLILFNRVGRLPRELPSRNMVNPLGVLRNSETRIKSPHPVAQDAKKMEALNPLNSKSDPDFQ